MQKNFTCSIHLATNTRSYTETKTLRVSNVQEKKPSVAELVSRRAYKCSLDKRTLMLQKNKKFTNVLS